MPDIKPGGYQCLRLSGARTVQKHHALKLNMGIKSIYVTVLQLHIIRIGSALMVSKSSSTKERKTNECYGMAKRKDRQAGIR